MPFSIIPTVLSVCFLLVWIFIGGMVLRDGHFAARREFETDVDGRTVDRGTHRTRPRRWSAKLAGRNVVHGQSSAA